MNMTSTKPRKNEPPDPDWVLKMIVMHEDGATYRELGTIFGVSHMTCYTIINSWKTWALSKGAMKRRIKREIEREVQSQKEKIA